MEQASADTVEENTTDFNRDNDKEQLNVVHVPETDNKEEKQVFLNRKSNEKVASVEKVNYKMKNESDDSLLNDLRISIIQGNFDAVKVLIEEKGVFVDSILQAGWTALMYACSCGEHEIVQYLLKQNADPNFHKDMFTPLMACCASRRDDEENLLKCAVLVIESGAKINDKERHHMTPLLFASREGHTSIVQKLIEDGADVNRRDTRGLCGLAWASGNGFGQVVRLLLNNGADPNIKTMDGQTAADIAYSKGFNEIAEILTQASEKENTAQNFLDGNKSDFVRNIAHFSELEMFFVGIGRGDLLPIFYENELSYKDLFKLNEEELEKIGVSDPGDRKIILKEIFSLNKCKFKTSNELEIQSRNRLSCTEAVLMMSNISKHLAYIGGAIVYIRQKIQTHPRILELSQQSFNVHSLIMETEQGIKNAHHLYEELKFLALYLKQLQDSKYIPADVITEVATSTCRSTRWEFRSRSFYLLGITSLSLVFGSLWWKYPHLFAKYSTLLNFFKRIINR